MMRMRTQGVLLFLAGLLLSASSIGAILIQVRDGVQHIQVMQSGIICGIVAMTFGMPMIILGERARVLKDMHRLDLREIRPWMWAVFLGSMALSGSALVLTLGYLRDEGYQKVPTTLKKTPEPANIPSFE